MKALPTDIASLISPTRTTTSSAEIQLVAIITTAYFLIWFSLGGYSLFNNNEGVYASVAKDMLTRLDWVIPHLNGVPYQEKPPLHYYLLTLSFALFGANEWSARAVSAVSASACLAIVYWATNTLACRATARLATLMLVSSIGFVMLARVVMPDMLLIGCFTAALLTSFVAWRRRSAALYALSLVALALAVMAKGLLALLLFGLIWALYIAASWRTEDKGLLRFITRPLPCFAFLSVAAPWHIAAIIRDPDFVWAYFVNEHVMRFLGQRIPVDTYSGSVLYYLPRLVLLFFPWVFLLPAGLSAKPARSAADLDRFAWMATVVIVGFFTASSAKANYYVALALPSAAVWLALRLTPTQADGPSSRQLLLIGAMTCLVLVTGVWAVSLEVRWEAVLRRWRWDALYPSLPLVIGTLAAATWVGRSRGNRWQLPGCATALMLALALAVVSVNEPKVSVHQLLEGTYAKCPDCTVMLYRDYEGISAAGFYTRQTVIPVIDSESDDLWWGQVKHPDAESFVTSSDVLRRAMRGEHISVVVTRHERKHFLGSPLGRFSVLLRRRGGVSTYRVRTTDETAQALDIPLP